MPAGTEATKGSSRRENHLARPSPGLPHRSRSHGRIRSLNDLDADDWRRTHHRFTDGNLERNLRNVDEVRAVAAEVGATPAQVALAWLLAQGDDIAPIPGTKRMVRLAENAAADGVELTAGHLARLNDLPPASGERYDADNMAAIDRS